MKNTSFFSCKRFFKRNSQSETNTKTDEKINLENKKIKNKKNELDEKKEEKNKFNKNNKNNKKEVDDATDDSEDIDENDDEDDDEDEEEDDEDDEDDDDDDDDGVEENKRGNSKLERFRESVKDKQVSKWSVQPTIALIPCTHPILFFHSPFLLFFFLFVFLFFFISVFIFLLLFLPLLSNLFHIHHHHRLCFSLFIFSSLTVHSDKRICRPARG